MLIDELTSVGLTVAQVDANQFLLTIKKKVIDTERKIKFNHKMGVLNQSIMDAVFNHIEASDKTRKETH